MEIHEATIWNMVSTERNGYQFTQMHHKQNHPMELANKLLHKKSNMYPSPKPTIQTEDTLHSMYILKLILYFTPSSAVTCDAYKYYPRLETDPLHTKTNKSLPDDLRNTRLLLWQLLFNTIPMKAAP